MSNEEREKLVQATSIRLEGALSRIRAINEKLQEHINRRLENERIRSDNDRRMQMLNK